MLNEAVRETILQLHQRGHSKRSIARMLSVSRSTVRAVIEAGTARVPRLERQERAEEYREQIPALLKDCKGNLVRVHEKLTEEGLQLSYPALTAFCRRHGLTVKTDKRTGRYHFSPGKEMQHDTSPHDVEIGGKRRRVQTASLVLCYSRMLFFQFYPRFRRFECKVFLTEAIRYHGGACQQCMIDNTHVVVAKGTGAAMVPAPEMDAFSQRLDFRFVAHERGDANRSGRVERPFHFIENNFLAGRSFRDWTDANAQARQWCDRVNGTYKKHLRAIPRELYAMEQAHLRPLPRWVPDPYLVHQRLVDLEGYVNLDTNRYSVPSDLIRRQVEVHETKDRVTVFVGPSHRGLSPTARRADRTSRLRSEAPSPAASLSSEASPGGGSYPTESTRAFPLHPGHQKAEASSDDARSTKARPHGG